MGASGADTYLTSRASELVGIGARARVKCRFHADVAQLVEHNLAKVGVAGSSPVVRSKTKVQGRM